MMDTSVRWNVYESAYGKFHRGIPPNASLVLMFCLDKYFIVGTRSGIRNYIQHIEQKSMEMII